MGRGTNDTGRSQTAGGYGHRNAAGRPSRARQLGAVQWAATIDKKIFPKPGVADNDDGYTIAMARHEQTGELIKIKGNFGPVSAGDIIDIESGAWRDDPNNPWEKEFFYVRKTKAGVPATRDAVIRHLATLPDVEHAGAVAIVDALGPGCLERIDADPQLLLSVSGRAITRQQLADLAAAWPRLAAHRVNLVYLDALGLTGAQARKASAHFADKLIEAIKENPYVLTRVDGIGFRAADRVAARLGLRATDPRRMAAGVEYVLAEAESDGHVCLTRDALNQRAPEMLFRRGTPRPPRELIMQAIEQQIDDGRLWEVTDETDGIDRVYTTEFFVIETRLYEKFEALITAAPRQLPETLAKPADSILTDEQWGAVEKVFADKLSILTGGPGTGKTTALRAVVEALDEQRQTYVCLAPTGKAAKRMEQSTGRDASTIHRQLGFDGLRPPSSREDGNVEPTRIIDADVVIVDESSMVDMRLMERLVSHLAPDTRLMLVGDPHQLPAVGAGSVLHDLLESERASTTELRTVHRQAQNSLLIVNANRIKDGQEPYWTAAQAEREIRAQAQAAGEQLPDDFHVIDDWRFYETDDPQTARRLAVKLAVEVQDELAIGPDDVVATAPVRKGDIGVYQLNADLQRQFNPHGVEIRSGDQPLRTGDRVMNTVNRYGQRRKRNGVEVVEPDIMNGEMGRIVDYNEKTGTVKVDFGVGEDIAFNRDQLKALIPAYCATTHKLQGSEAPAVIAPLLEGTGDRMASKQLVYTGWTRARELCCVIGSKQALRKAIARDGSQRNTRLDLMVARVGPRIKARWELMAEKQRQLQARKKRGIGRGLVRHGSAIQRDHQQRAAAAAAAAAAPKP